MKPDSMLVEAEYVVRAHEEVVAKGSDGAMAELAKTEPALAAFVQHGLVTVAGKLALTGAPTEVVQGAYQDALAIILAGIAALRHGHYELWKDMLAATPTEVQPEPKERRRRKKSDATPPPSQAPEGNESGN
jgi:hypothetical protein